MTQWSETGVLKWALRAVAELQGVTKGWAAGGRECPEHKAVPNQEPEHGEGCACGRIVSEGPADMGGEGIWEARPKVSR